jgi:RIO-like serine/threonine protein kinase
VSAAPERRLLKRDQFGCVTCVIDPASTVAASFVERDTTAAAWWARSLARRLAAREARALVALDRVPGVPRLLAWDGRTLRRSWLDGQPMHRGPPASPAYFRESLRLLRRLHAAGVVHNDLAKEPNWLVAPGEHPALVDFQLALRPRTRGWLFRALAHDDLRHMLKHKRTYFPERLTRRERAVLDRRSPIGTVWAWTGKPVYRLVTRGLLGWADREGAGDRSQA